MGVTWERHGLREWHSGRTSAARDAGRRIVKVVQVLLVVWSIIPWGKCRSAVGSVGWRVRGTGMSDTRALLTRISAFRQRLEQTPPLTPVTNSLSPTTLIPDRAAALAMIGEWLSHSLRQLAGPAMTDGSVPPRLTARARRLLEEARDVVAVQKQLTDDPVLNRLSAPRPPRPDGTLSEPEPIVSYHRATVAMTEAALRLVQAFPESAEVQLRLCEGLEAMLRGIRERLGVAQQVLADKKRELLRRDRLSRILAALSAGHPVQLQALATLAEELLEDARRGLPIRFLSGDPAGFGGVEASDNSLPMARYVAATSLTVAQVVARIAPHDYEWASRPLVPVVAALLMDVGMVSLPASVIGKGNALTAEEYRQVERHPAKSAEIIRRLLPEAVPLADAIAAHHERLDGTGYPQALSGEAIPSLARLLAVCDHYAAMASDRPHRLAHDPRHALTETMLAAEQGRLDRDFSEYLLNLSFHPVGTVIELTDGRIGVVVAVHTGRVNLRATTRPVVAILIDENGQTLARPDYVDLAASERGSIMRAVPTAECRRRLANRYPDICG